QVVFFAQADGAVGEEHERAAPGQPADRVIRVNPRVHAGRRRELRARRAQLRRDDLRCRSKLLDERAHPSILAILSAPVPPDRTLLDRLNALPAVPFAPGATPVDEPARLRAALGGGPRLLVNRDDAIAFASGGNKVRKLRLGAAALAQAFGELVAQIDPPAVIVHASSSAGTQAGFVAGCRMHGLRTQVIGVSADEPSMVLAGGVRGVLRGIEGLLGASPGVLADARVEVDDGFVGDGYGIPTPASEEALRLCATTEALFLDPTYTAKAMAGLIARVRDGRFTAAQTVLFWHTGGQVGLFA